MHHCPVQHGYLPHLAGYLAAGHMHWQFCGSFSRSYSLTQLDLSSSWAPAGLLQAPGRFAELFHVVRARLLLGSCWAPGSFAGVFTQLELDAVRLGLLLGSCWAVLQEFSM